MNDATLPYPIDLAVKKRSINLVFDGGGGDKRSKRGGLSMICPRCKDKVSDLVSRYERHNLKTGKGEAYTFEISICEICVHESILQVQEYEKKSNHKA